MTPDRKTCQNCKAEFLLEAADLDFYRAVAVPGPTFCPQCRFQRRLMFINQMTLYKRTCAKCGGDTPSVFAPEKPYTVYCGSCWKSRSWDGTEYGMEYDPSKHFFDQFRELLGRVPVPALYKFYASVTQSDYTNYVAELKNCYLVFDAYGSENCYYTWMSDKNRDSMDLLLSNANEQAHECINCDLNNRIFYSEDCEECFNVYFSKNLVGCSDCVGCVNLKNKQYHIFNQPYSPADYKRKFAELTLSSSASVLRLRREARGVWARYPQRVMSGQQNENVSGEYIYNSKNVHDSYVVYGAENCRYLQILTVLGASDSQDYTNGGGSASRVYDCIMLGGGVYQMKWSVDCWADKSANIEYSRNLNVVSDCFGCVGLEKKQYCILNKQYSKDDYEKLRATLVRDMTERPYTDAKGRVYRYGEFFPYDLSYFDYNETAAEIFFPITKETAEAAGWTWRPTSSGAHVPTRHAGDLSDDIRDTPDSILQEIIGCASCPRAFRIAPGELRLLREWNLPLPRACFWCRNDERVRRLRPLGILRRTCSKCGKEIVSSINPSRPEIIYCDACYLREAI